MRSPQRWEQGLVALGIALGVGFAVMPTASADPDGAVHTDAAPLPGPAAPVLPELPPVVPGAAADPAPVPVASTDDPGAPAVTACSTFASALDSASTFYGDFADSIEGLERPDYGDPTVSTTNTSGRTALREAAGSAMNAAGTPGLSPDIANPMRSWSFGATKLLLKMGLRTGGQSLNDTATQLNSDASNAQMACAAAGTHA
ncbi:hypothetical protein M2272_001247 [Mycobacterium frederiksbergense]|uniref:Uncharacterized protein n=1 Tax=Mycolicibacterium frederiksbergense TaxID=117567 RepID=A0ABT6KV77_9MYCO|nr:hypothetical protein [Mycolicibacterium frederiksbergense]MDH6194618.1 hypothetical protein [Mycolicibacterium frederiksbergense]